MSLVIMSTDQAFKDLLVYLKSHEDEQETLKKFNTLSAEELGVYLEEKNKEMSSHYIKILNGEIPPTTISIKECKRVMKNLHEAIKKKYK